MAFRCVAPLAQRQLRDLSYLPDMVDSVTWTDWSELRDAHAVAIICGLAVRDAPLELRKAIHGRSMAGFSTLVVPRLVAQDLGPVLGAPTLLAVRPGETQQTTWESGEVFNVSSMTHVETALPGGRLGMASESRTTVLAYRAHSTAGMVLVCTPTTCGLALGVQREEQGRLLRQMLSYVMERCPSSPQPVSLPFRQRATSLDAFLDEEGDSGALVLLGLLACPSPSAPAELATAIADSLGVLVDTSTIERLLLRLTAAQSSDLAATLSRRGWASYVRRLRTHRAGGT